MDSNAILVAIDEALGGSDRCACGRELFPREHERMLWLECPVFAGPSRLPARLAAFARELVHDRRPMAAFPAAGPTRRSVVAAPPAPRPTTHPATVRG